MSGDRLAELLTAEADRLSAGVVPPPVSSLRPARGLRVAAPLAAAAAVALVAGAAVVVADHAPGSRRGVVTDVGAPVPYSDDLGRSRFGDAPAPRQVLVGAGRSRSGGRDESIELCRAGDLAARLTPATPAGGRRLELSWTAPRGAEHLCRLADAVPALTLLDAAGTEVARARNLAQPPVANPPETAARHVTAREGLPTAFAWTSHCGSPPVRAELTGLTATPVRVDVAGAVPPCRRGSPGQPVLGLLGGAGVVPADRDGLQVSLATPGSARAGELVTLVARLANPTSAPISLDPCPTYLLEQRERFEGRDGLFGTSGGQTRRVPCDALPAAVEPGTAVTFEVRERIGNATPDVRGVHPNEVRFGIAGAAAWAGTVDVDYGIPPEPVATVPWADTPRPPGEPQQGAPPLGTALPLAPLHPTIEDLSRTAERGELVRYRVRLTNTASGGDPVPLRPCPGFVQTLQFADHPRVEDEHYVNCAAAPEELAAGDALWLEMQLRVPENAPLGQATLGWKLGKLDMGPGGSESAYVGLRIVGG